MSGRPHLVAGGRPRLAVLAVRDGDEDEHAGRLIGALAAAGPVDPCIATAPHGGELDAAVLDEVDGVLLGGGPTPASGDGAVAVRREPAR
jgi:cyanophycinase